MPSHDSFTRRKLLWAAATVTVGMVGASDSALTAPATDNRSRKLYLAQAKTAVEVLQRWFHTQPFVQWGNDQNPWNTYNTMEALIDYTQITRDRRYVNIIRQAATDPGLIARIQRDGVDDEAWAGIALVKAGYVKSFL